jgi:hypothetical protein
MRPGCCVAECAIRETGVEECVEERRTKRVQCLSSVNMLPSWAPGRPCPDGAHLRVAYRIGWEASPRATRQSISSHTAGSHVPAPPPPGAFLLTRRPNRESPGRCGKALPELGNGFPGSGVN